MLVTLVIGLVAVAVGFHSKLRAQNQNGNAPTFTFSLSGENDYMMPLGGSFFTGFGHSGNVFTSTLLPRDIVVSAFTVTGSGAPPFQQASFAIVDSIIHKRILDAGLEFTCAFDALGNINQTTKLACPVFLRVPSTVALSVATPPLVTTPNVFITVHTLTPDFIGEVPTTFVSPLCAVPQ
jgi:hypothetical protein